MQGAAFTAAWRGVGSQPPPLMRSRATSAQQHQYRQQACHADPYYREAGRSVRAMALPAGALDSEPSGAVPSTSSSTSPNPSTRASSSSSSPSRVGRPRGSKKTIPNHLTWLGLGGADNPPSPFHVLGLTDHDRNVRPPCAIIDLGRPNRCMCHGTQQKVSDGWKSASKLLGARRAPQAFSALLPLYKQPLQSPAPPLPVSASPAHPVLALPLDPSPPTLLDPSPPTLLDPSPPTLLGRWREVQLLETICTHHRCVGRTHSTLPSTKHAAARAAALQGRKGAGRAGCAGASAPPLSLLSLGCPHRAAEPQPLYDAWVS